MSRETLEWLSNNTLIGFTEKRGHAWHHRAGDDNTYADAIPVEHVHKRLFSWTAEERPLYVGGSGPYPKNWAEEVSGRKAIVRSDTGDVMGIFRDGYQPHQYGEWLLDNVASILDADLQVGSAGLLRGGAVAWVSVEMPDTVETPEGVEFRPFLLACTSFDGSIATTYKEVVTSVVCDNTMSAALREDGATVKVRHSSQSLTRIQSVRDALGIVHKISEDFQAEVSRLTAVQVDDVMWERIVKELVPMPDDPVQSKRAATMATTKREVMMRLWRHDERVAPWAGTAFGAWQAFNTYGQHEGIVRGMSRQERNMLNAVNGTIEKSDAETVRKILEMAA
ncbi:DUF932 domain-containing protein [Streptomyces sp. NPDC057854]|uniref:DUF932 domain-containing protein n=1 Tax=unclassified Streptomyces TaxID=2593676 RepID=UPI003674CD77